MEKHLRGEIFLGGHEFAAELHDNSKRSSIDSLDIGSNLSPVQSASSTLSHSRFDLKAHTGIVPKTVVFPVVHSHKASLNATTSRSF